jgi:glycosyltransferase involved in cell wall biosynthesis
MHVGSKRGIQPIKLLAQFLQTKAIIVGGNYDLVHAFGANRMGHWTGLLSLLAFKTPTVLTLAQASFPESLRLIKWQLWKNIFAVFTTTEYLRDECRSNRIDASLIRHGIMRDISSERGFNSKAKRSRVLFWRDPSFENGADVCLAAFKKLAPRYPNFSFDFAIRPFPTPVDGLEEISRQFSNINVFRYPYENGKTLSHFISEAACIVLPFRELSTHPQLAVLESLLAKRPVITTNIASNREMITTGQNGYLTPPGDVVGVCEAIEQCLKNPDQSNVLAKRASVEMHKMWRWDQYVQDLEHGYEHVLSDKRTSCLVS